MWAQLNKHFDGAETGPFTLYAPTNEAFKSASDSLRSKFRNDVKHSLMGHIVTGLQSVDQLTDGSDLTSLTGVHYKVAVAAIDSGSYY